MDANLTCSSPAKNLTDGEQRSAFRGIFSGEQAIVSEGMKCQIYYLYDIIYSDTIFKSFHLSDCLYVSTDSFGT